MRGHWILTIINPHKDEICLFDPLHEGIVDDAWKDVVDMYGLKNVQCRDNGKQTKKMSFNMESHQGSVDMDSMQSLFKEKIYSTDQIDEMRVEWAECIQREI
ncbi:hypothetical protein ACS0TY_029050 [Phlomoides rotata]